MLLDFTNIHLNYPGINLIPVLQEVILCRNYHRVFSGIQPTGTPHLGNYFGAIKKWVDLQNSGTECIFSIVDLHSITLPQDPETLRGNIQKMAACLLACGINPDLCVLFLQSEVPQHALLQWILGCSITMARLAQLPQYKEKSGELKNIPQGIFAYPVLQSADILLYKATLVPVGEDQLQHLQLAQHFAKHFNNRFKNIFPVPTAESDTQGSRIKSLRQPSKKMSKSDFNSKSRIELDDSPDIITNKVKKAVTDFTSAVTYDPENRPGVSNLITIHSLFTGKTPANICEENESLDTGQYKNVVADIIIEHLRPLQRRMHEILQNPSYIEKILCNGSEKASEIATKTLDEVKNVMGLSYVSPINKI